MTKPKTTASGRRKITPAFRKRCVEQVTERLPEFPSLYATTEAVAAAEGVSSETVRRWVRQANDGTLPTRKGPAPARVDYRVSAVRVLQARVAELEKEVAYWRAQHDRAVAHLHAERADRVLGPESS